jgi:hypothetical protein
LVSDVFDLVAKSVDAALERLGCSLLLLPLEPWTVREASAPRVHTLTGRAAFVRTTLGRQPPVLDGPAFPIPALPVIAIGRSSHATLVVDQPTISRIHAELVQEADVCRIKDHGSYNGTFLNGRVLEPGETPPLAEGDVVGLGENQLLFCSLRYIGKLIAEAKRL